MPYGRRWPDTVRRMKHRLLYDEEPPAERRYRHRDKEVPLGSVEEFVDETLHIGLAMEEYGGGFSQALGTALIRADLKNRVKIYETWPDLMKKYKQMYEDRWRDS